MPPEAGQILQGDLFSEPVRIVTVEKGTNGSWSLGVVGTSTRRFSQVMIPTDQLARLVVLSATSTFDGDGALLRLGIQAYALGIAYEFDPYFGLSISRVDPLPHQLAAVYDHLLKLPIVRFLLADDAGAGKTIMTGLLLRELKLRGLLQRILIVGPANLAFQWQREMSEKFGEKFVVMRGSEVRTQFGVNPWRENAQVITSLDLAKRDDILPGLKQVHWDLVVVDEAHRMSASSEDKKSLRYNLGELLRDTTDHYLLLTATPHKGDPENFNLFLQLLDRDAFAHVRSIQEAMKAGQAPFYLRRTKEAMVFFPEQQENGTWTTRPIFTRRIPNTVAFSLDGEEFRLYTEVSHFVRSMSSRAAAQAENDPRARAMGFLMALYQRRLASSTAALRESLERRANLLVKKLGKAEDLAKEGSIDIPDPDELDEMEEEARESFERRIEAVTLTQNRDAVNHEVSELRRLATRCQSVMDAAQEAKLGRLKQLLHDQGFFENRQERLLIFTEYKDTLDYIVRSLSSWGFTVGAIHGSMKSGSRDEPGTRLFSEQQFRDGDIQILVATEAAGEGINLQVCHIMVNYDIPWNPNRLEQRMGRIHRYGQKKDCLIFNFVATNTIEGRVLTRLLEKLQEIRNALESDSVFNVVGEVFPASHIERIFRDYYAGKLGEGDVEERVLEPATEDQFRALCQNALEGLASKSLNIQMLVERRAKAQERRLVPETIARFLKDSAQTANLTLRAVSSIQYTFDAGPTPLELRTFESDENWRLPALSNRYGRLTTDRTVAEKENLEWVTPGHPLFESLRRHAWKSAQPTLAKGACFYSLEHAEASRLDLYKARVVDGNGKTVHERLYLVEVSGAGEPTLRDLAILGDLLPGTKPDRLPSVALAAEAAPYLNEHALQPLLEEVKRERLAEVERIRKHVDWSLTELLQKEDQKIGRYAMDKDQGVEGAAGFLAQAEIRHHELTLRRDRRRLELSRQAQMTLQDVERIASALILPHPDRNLPQLRNLRQDKATEAFAMEFAIAHEKRENRVVVDVHEKNLGYDITSFDPQSGELRLIEVKGLSHDGGDILLTPNEHRVAQDRRDCYWLYVVTGSKSDQAKLIPVKDPATYPWKPIQKVQHYTMNTASFPPP